MPSTGGQQAEQVDKRHHEEGDSDALVTPQAPAAAPVKAGGVDPLAAKSRDRIVILGRRRAGKTIYLARLYEQLWNSRGTLHMRALSGESHMACMEVVEELRAGRWPASTLGAHYTDIEIEFEGNKRLLVAPDYPGEVFRQAFVEGAESEDTRTLIDHVDRAAAVLILLDPAVANRGSASEAVDDDYGMAQAIRRIREWPGGEQVPIVFVLTKCDIHKHLLRERGGLREFLVENYVNLLRPVGRFRVYASSAIQAVRGEDKSIKPSFDKPPIGVIEPLQFCLERMAELEWREREQRETDERAKQLRDYRAAEHRAQRRTVLFWSIFWSAAVALMGTVAVVTWILTQGEG